MSPVQGVEYSNLMAKKKSGKIKNIGLISYKHAMMLEFNLRIPNLRWEENKSYWFLRKFELLKNERFVLSPSHMLYLEVKRPGLSPHNEHICSMTKKYAKKFSKKYNIPYA